MTRKNIPVCLCCDLNYLRYACVTLASVAYTSSEPVDFYILHSGISKELQNIVVNWMKSRFPKDSLTFLDISRQLSLINVKQVRHFNALVFGRYFIPQLLPGAHKAIYLDSDTIVLDDIAALGGAALGGAALGGIYEYWQDNNDWGEKIKNDLEYLNLSGTHKYFSSGVLLLDCDKWRQENITQRLLNLYQKYREITQYPDQDPLNKLFENNYKELDAKFNVTEQTIISYKGTELLDLKNTVVVRHFAGDNKPWNQVYLYSDANGKDCSDNFNDWWFFAGMTPFYDAISNDFLEKQMKDFKSYEIPRLIGLSRANTICQEEFVSSVRSSRSCRYVLFGFVPLLKIKTKKNGKKVIYKLFGSLPVLSIKRKRNRSVYLLFGLLPLLSVMRK